MKKNIVLTSLLLIGLLLLTACGENKKKAELFGLNTAVASAQDMQLASSVGALYDVTKIGAGVGTTSFGVRGRSYVGSNITGLGEADATGEYTVTNSGTPGMVCKVKFLKGTEVVYFNMAKTFGPNNDSLLLYTTKDLGTTPNTLADIPRDATITTFFPKYLPSMFSKLDGTPLDWLTITLPADPTQALTTIRADVTTFISNNFPDSMVNTVNGTIAGGTIALTLNASMTDKPTDAKPAHLTGSGTITMTSGEVLAVNCDVYVGASGPVSGTQTFTSTSGISGTMTFNADKTMSGTISKAGAVIATVSIAADGTGTLTDANTGAVSAI